MEAEIIVVDNNSSDDSCKMVKTLFPEVKLIENKENTGFSKGNNMGVSHARGEYICILNPDTVVAEDTFESVLAFADLQENLGIIGCRLIDGKGRFLPESKRYVPTPMVSVKKILGNSKPYYATKLKQFENGKVEILVGAFMLMKKKLYVELHGFDEDFFMYGEDVDLSYRVLKKGLDNFYFGTATAIHFKGESTLKDITYAKRFYKAMQVFYKKHFRNHGLFDVLVWLGSILLPFFKSTRSIPDSTPKYKVVVGSEKNKLLSLLNPDKYIKCIETYEQDTEYIFDNNCLTFKEIIQQMDKFPENSSSTFKILPKNSNFMLGSNSPKTKGEILFLQDI